MLSCQALCVFCQEDVDFKLLSHNKIKVRFGYSISLDQAKDTTLLTEEHFNTEGRKIYHKNYRPNGNTSEYIYKYKDDT